MDVRVYRASPITAAVWAIIALGLVAGAVVVVRDTGFDVSLLGLLGLAAGAGALAWRWATYRLRFAPTELTVGRMVGAPHVVAYRDVTRARFYRVIQTGRQAAAVNLASRVGASRTGVPFEDVPAASVPGSGAYRLVLEQAGRPPVAVNLKLLRRERHVGEVYEQLQQRLPPQALAAAQA